MMTFERQKIHLVIGSGRHFIFIFAVVICCLFFMAHTASAASMFFQPSNGVYMLDESFTVVLGVDTQGMGVNAVEATLEYNPKELRVIEVNEKNSVFTLWAEKPAVDHDKGTIHFEAGSSQKVENSFVPLLSITFKVLALTKQSLVHIPVSAALAADNKGSNVLSQVQPGSYTLMAKTIPPNAENFSPQGGTLSVPEIRSSTHPVQGKWYKNDSPSFAWDVPQGVLGVRVSYNKIPRSLPEKLYQEPLGNIDFSSIEEGAWYLHVQFSNAKGWGAVGHYAFYIDSTKPETLDINEYQNDDATDPRVPLIILAKDTVSGVDYYEIQIDNGAQETWFDDGSGKYTTRALSPGKHMFVAKAFDKAGNFTVNTFDIEIKALTPPLIIHALREVKPGDIFTLSGESKYPNATAVIVMQKEGAEQKQYDIPTDANGGFIFFLDESLPNGVYKIWATIRDMRGAVSTPSETRVVAIMPSGFMRIGSYLVDMLSLTVVLIAVSVLFILMSLYAYKKLLSIKKILRKETREAERTVASAFEGLKKDVAHQLHALEKIRDVRELTVAEKMMSKKLGKHLAGAEEKIEKELSDIETEIG